jgi:hypothetical protein
MESQINLKKYWKSLALIVMGFALATAGLFASSAQALNINSPRDCDSNAVLRCGALTAGQLQYKYNKQDGAKAIFNYFDIHTADINNIGNTAIAGNVTSDGKVLVNGKVVATNAITAGRQNIAGSQTVNFQGTTFYVRSTGVSFASSSLAAFVVMNGNQFSFAILASCGNPVKAQPVQQPQQPVAIAPAHAVKKPPHKPAKPKPVAPQAPATTNVNNNNNVNVQVSNQQQQQQQSAPPKKQIQKEEQTTTPAAPAQTQSQTTQPAKTVHSAPVSSSPSTLPNTGPGPEFIVAGAATVIGTVGHLFFTRRKLAI